VLAAALRSQGDAHYMQGRYADAAARYEESLRIDPTDADTQNNYGAAIAELGRLSEAITHYQEALRLRPQFADAYYNLGNAFRLSNRNAEAATCYGTALRHRPNFAEGHNNLGIALRKLYRVTEAEISLREAIRLRPNYPLALVNLGLALADAGRLVEAVALYDEALRLEPNNADAHRNRSLAWLLAGDLGRGFLEYTWRWRCSDFSPPRFTRPAWDGSPLQGRSILLYTEQGLGDTIMFVRFAQEIQTRGGVVTLAAQEPLLPLLRTCAGIDRLVPRDPLPDDCDTQLPLLNVPAVLGTTLAAIPAQIPYLTADPTRVERWRSEIATLGSLKVGIAWQGNAAIHYDGLRAIPLRHFEPLAKMEGISLVSMQKGLGTEQLSSVGFPVLDLGPRLDLEGGAFSDTAALMKSLDLVISCDTAVIHLAGALGVPAWLVLPKIPHWSWLLDREDTPWYPSVRIFRQELTGDWTRPFAKIAEELRRYVRPA
jgi:Flp pilus assembly protein TadD